MRWIRFGVVALLALLGIYALSVYYFIDESKAFMAEREVNYPLEKIYSQFSNLQDFARWNTYFSGSQKNGLQFYAPYDGQDATMSFLDPESGRHGEMYIRYAKPPHSLRYQLFEKTSDRPYTIDVKFSAVSPSRTKIRWTVHTPVQPLLLRPANLFSEGRFSETLDASMARLEALMGNRVDRENRLASVKYDSLMVEQEKGSLLLGINVSTANKKETLIKNITLNHNKVYNYITNDLGKREEEFGLPVMVSDPSNFKEKEISYFYGFPLSKRTGLSDNNFGFRTVNPAKTLVMYYKGSFSGRSRAVQQLLQKAKKDTLRSGELYETFLEPPSEEGELNIKMALPVFR